MKLSISTRDEFFEKLIRLIDGQKYGSGFTKTELAQKFGYRSADTVEGWVRRYPKLIEYRCFIQINEGRTRTAVFTNKKYRDELIRTKQATEYY